LREIIVRLMPWEKHRVRRLVREEGTEDGRRRYRVILALHKGLHPRTISEVEDISLVTVYRVSRRYLAGGQRRLGRVQRSWPSSRSWHLFRAHDRGRLYRISEVGACEVKCIDCGQAPVSIG
jgi:hypothetical protein